MSIFDLKNQIFLFFYILFIYIYFIYFTKWDSKIDILTFYIDNQ